jgi:hypothetical protein
MVVGEARGCIFSHVRPFYEQAVSDPDRSMHRSLWALVAHNSFIEGSHMTKNTASGAYPRVEHLAALPTNIRLGWKGLPETNSLAYYKNPYITAVNFFIVQAPVRVPCPSPFPQISPYDAESHEDDDDQVSML